MADLTYLRSLLDAWLIDARLVDGVNSSTSLGKKVSGSVSGGFDSIFTSTNRN